MSTDVSVVIPTHRRSELLRTALESVAAQTHDPVEAVVVDNSADGVAEPLVAEFPEATYVWQLETVPRHEVGHRNIAISRDIGVDRAAGEYVHFLDADDELHPRAVEAKLAAIERTPDAEAAYSTLYRHDGVLVNIPDPVVGRELAFVLIYLRSPALPSTLLVRRSVLEDCPPRRSLPHEDLAGLVEVLRRTDIVYVDEPLTTRNEEPTSARSLGSQRGRLETYERYESLRAELLSDRERRRARMEYESVQETVRELEAESA